MRIAILSDIHANIEALGEVEAAVQRLQVDRVVCLGDVIGYGASPRACCDRIRRLAQTTLLGNHDAAACGRMDYEYYYEAARTVLDWTVKELQPAQLTWLRSLPYTERLDDVVFSHGSPIEPAAFDYVFALEQAAELLPHYEELASVTFIGHSHLCKSFALALDGTVEDVSARRIVLSPGRKYIVTAGSVGQPRDSDCRACFVVYDTETRVVDYYRVAYDIKSAAQRIYEAGLARNFGRRLFLGV